MGGKQGHPRLRNHPFFPQADRVRIRSGLPEIPPAQVDDFILQKDPNPPGPAKNLVCPPFGSAQDLADTLHVLEGQTLGRSPEASVRLAQHSSLDGSGHSFQKIPSENHLPLERVGDRGFAQGLLGQGIQTASFLLQDAGKPGKPF
jgi:hypothetical protein